MEAKTRAPAPAPAAAARPAGPASAATWAKGALRRLAQAQLEPTPENYARAYAEEAGVPAPAALTASPPSPPSPAAAAPVVDAASDGPAWAGLIERIARHLERPGRQWTPARRKDSLQRVLAGSRSDASRLRQRLQGLTTAWETDTPGDAFDLGAEIATTAEGPAIAAGDAPPAGPGLAAVWPAAAQALHGSVQAGLPASDPRAAELAAALADELAAVADAIACDGAAGADGSAGADHLRQLQTLCDRARRLFAHRHHLVDELGALCRELAAGLTDLAEDDSWARGQCASLQARLGEATADGSPSVRSVRAATELLADTRVRQQQVRGQRQAAQAAIKALIRRMISGAGELGDEAGRYQQALSGHAQAIAGADSLASLAGVVQTLLDDSQAVQSAVSATRERLHSDQADAQGLEARVRELEGELRRLSDEVATDALTQVANRRGLTLAFDTIVSSSARSRHDGQTPLLAIGLLDIDNFKKLNDTLGHGAGDEALKTLAAAVRDRLRPVDHIARFGGEEFVVLLPDTPLAEARQALTRLQRSLSAGLFMHEGRDVFVTFSAGVTAWQPGEALETALERADEALYEAKRTGKNRTCTG